jgi:hypothetical protein
MSVSLAASTGAVRFEIPGIAASARLVRRLARRWNVVLRAAHRDLNVVVAELRGEPDDLAALLREVEAWVEEESLSAIRFELDDRAYVLEAGETNWTSVDPVAVGAGDHARRASLVEALDSVDFAIAELSGRGAAASRPDMQGLERLRNDIALALRLLD